MSSENKKSSEMKTLAKNTAILASPKILTFVIGILRSKLIAIFLGTAGFGIVDQLSSTIGFIRQSTLSFLPDGMVKLIAKEKSEKFDRKIIGDIIKTYFFMMIPLAIFVFVLAFIFSDGITIFIFGDIKYKSYFLIGLIAVPITFLGVTFDSFLKAFKEIKSIAIKDVSVTILNFIIFVPLVYYFKVTGGVIYVTISFIISLIVTFKLVKKNVFIKYNISFKNVKNAVFSNIYFKELLTFISVGIIGGTFRVFENMASRAIVVNELGIDKIGLYAPIVKWQALFIGFILPAVFTYLYPRLSEAKNNDDITMVINTVVRMITFLTLPFILLGISTRDWIIPLFYSNEFIEAATYLPYHFSFLLMVVWGTIFEQIFAPSGRLKIFLVFLIIIYSLSLIMVYYFVPMFGLYGYLLKFTITPLLIVVSFFIYWKNEISFKFQKENIYIILYSVFCCIMMLIFKGNNNFIQLALSIILIAVMVIFLKENEKQFILKKLKLRS